MHKRKPILFLLFLYLVFMSSKNILSEEWIFIIRFTEGENNVWQTLIAVRVSLAKMKTER